MAEPAPAAPSAAIADDNEQQQQQQQQHADAQPATDNAHAPTTNGSSSTDVEMKEEPAEVLKPPHHALSLSLTTLSPEPTLLTAQRTTV